MHFKTILALSKELQSGAVSPVEVTDHIVSEVPRWYGDGRRIEVLAPVPFEEELLGFID